ncbi:MAG: hypothetical protein MUC84_04900 [Solirubrobacteraceae bacterium]|nr:hypothetical protein [Solirubrobacteraceae bacterium]
MAGLLERRLDLALDGVAQRVAPGDERDATAISRSIRAISRRRRSASSAARLGWACAERTWSSAIAFVSSSSCGSARSGSPACSRISAATRR